MTTAALRAKLFKTMNDLQKGRIDTKEARETSKIASQIVYSKRLELESIRLNIKLMKASKSKVYKNINIKPLDL